MMSYQDLRLPPRFWSKTEVDAAGCWLWRAYISQGGYGRYSVAGKPLDAHRVSFQALVRDPSPGKQIDHLCRVRHCVNPAHLEEVTHKINSLRGVGSPAVNARKDQCSRGGHPLAGVNLYVNPRGERECRTCRRAANARHNQKLRERVT